MGRFIKYPKIFRVGHEKAEGIFDAGKIVVEEKIDGANFRFGKIDGELRFGSRRVELTKHEDYGMFDKAVQFVKALPFDKMREGYVYFAEYTYPHTIKYDFERMPTLIGFDVYDSNADRFLGYDEKVQAFKELGMDTAPLVGIYDHKEITKDLLESIIPESKYYNGMAEGVVFKNYDLQKFAKLVAEKFKEENEKVFGKSKKRAQTDEEYILEKYIPPRRVEKVIQALEEDGYKIEMSLMKVLIGRVLENFIEECGKEFIFENKTVDLRKLRKIVSKRCVNVLRRYMLVREIERRR